MTPIASDQLAESITKKSSFQTYVTIKLLVDKDLVLDCFKAYAYFRWLDDQIDIDCQTKVARLDCIQRQQQIIDACYHNRPVYPACPEEQLIVDLITSNTLEQPKLYSFIHNFFAIIAFDAERKDTYISQQQLDWYMETLAKAVTDGIEHFINHTYNYPDNSAHYRAAIGAHIVHMLRDYHEDLQEGYINIPQEYLDTYHLRPEQIESKSFAAWVKHQLAIAKTHFQVGQNYIRRLSVLRGKLAASWYCARFESMMDEIVYDHYRLRPHYVRRGNVIKYMGMLFIAGKVMTNHYVDILLDKLS